MQVEHSGPPRGVGVVAGAGAGFAYSSFSCNRECSGGPDVGTTVDLGYVVAPGHAVMLAGHLLLRNTWGRAEYTQGEVVVGYRRWPLDYLRVTGSAGLAIQESQATGVVYGGAGILSAAYELPFLDSDHLSFDIRLDIGGAIGGEGRYAWFVAGFGWTFYVGGGLQPSSEPAPPPPTVP